MAGAGCNRRRHLCVQLCKASHFCVGAFIKNKQAAAARIQLRGAAKRRGAHIPGPLNAYIFQSPVLAGIHTTCGTTCSRQQPARKHT
jgi:hypothetical protein